MGAQLELRKLHPTHPKQGEPNQLCICLLFPVSWAGQPRVITWPRTNRSQINPPLCSSVPPAAFRRLTSHCPRDGVLNLDSTSCSSRPCPAFLLRGASCVLQAPWTLAPLLSCLKFPEGATGWGSWNPHEMPSFPGQCLSSWESSPALSVPP